MQQSSATQSLHLWFLGVAEDCCMLSILLAVPSCFNSFWHGVIPTSYFIFNDFYTCIYNIKVVSAYCPHGAHFRSICLGSVSVLRHYHAIFIPCVQLIFVGT